MARRSDRFAQYSADEAVTSIEDPRLQYTSDAPKITAGSYNWRAPQHPHAHPVPRGRMISFAGDGGGAPAGGGGGGPATRPDPLDQTGAEKFVARWRASQKHARKLGREFDKSVPQPWSASPRDYQEATDGGRGGNMGEVMSKPPTPSPTWRRPEGGASVGAKPLPNGGNGNGLSGGAAQKVPTGVSGQPSPYL
jgi:hypothetical protein